MTVYPYLWEVEVHTPEGTVDVSIETHPGTHRPVGLLSVSFRGDDLVWMTLDEAKRVRDNLSQAIAEVENA